MSLKLSTEFKRAIEAEVWRIAALKGSERMREQGNRWVHATRAVPVRGSSNRKAKKAAFELMKLLGRAKAKVRGPLVTFTTPMDETRYRRDVVSLEMEYGVRFKHKFGNPPPSVRSAVQLSSITKDTRNLKLAANYGASPRHRRLRRQRNRRKRQEAQEKDIDAIAKRFGFRRVGSGDVFAMSMPDYIATVTRAGDVWAWEKTRRFPKGSIDRGRTPSPATAFRLARDSF